MISQGTLLITGGAGFVGSCLAQHLINLGWKVVVYDNLSTGFKCALPPSSLFVQGDIRDSSTLREVFKNHKFQAVIHLAGVLNISESFETPEIYHEVNVQGTRNILAQCADFGVDKMIFSSSCTVYGNQNTEFCHELLTPDPISPYGKSKYECEQLITEFVKNGPLSALIFRYFNVAGALTDFSNGQRTKKVSQLIHRTAKVATGKIPSISICGENYKTADGTCVRDYIHIEDLIESHLRGLEYLFQGGPSEILNCGSGQGNSVVQVLDKAKKYSKAPFEITKENRRPGDPDYLVSDNKKIKSVLGWEPTRSEISHILETAIQWEEKL